MVVWFKLGVDRTILMDGRFTHELNSTGGMIWELCSGELTLKEMIRMVARRIALPEKDVSEDCIRFCNKLNRHNLVTLNQSSASN